MSVTIDAERVAIFSDIHSPLTDWDYLAEALAYTKKRKITTCILAGDVTHADSVSDYSPKQADAGLRADVVTTRQTIERIASEFNTTWLIKGNHDYRFVKKLGYAGSFSEVMGDVLAFRGKNFTILDDDHMYVDNAAGLTYVCHPTSYSRTPLSIPKQISVKTGTHVIAGHCHHSAFGYAPNGAHVLIEAGGFFDMENTNYIKSSTTYPRWVNGFSTIEDGRFYLQTKQGRVS